MVAGEALCHHFVDGAGSSPPHSKNFALTKPARLCAERTVHRSSTCLAMVLLPSSAGEAAECQTYRCAFHHTAQSSLALHPVPPCVRNFYLLSRGS